jgi:hypothetical protein
VFEVVKELIVSDFIRDNAKYIRKEVKKQKFVEIFGIIQKHSNNLI